VVVLYSDLGSIVGPVFANKTNKRNVGFGRPGRSLPGKNKEPNVKPTSCRSGGFGSVIAVQSVAAEQAAPGTRRQGRISYQAKRPI
jgi:hypothetical protein